MSIRRCLTGLRAVALAAIVAVLVGIWPHPASAQQTAAQQLAELYAPILVLKAQAENCDHDGEGYFPTTVDWLWGNPDTTLKVAGDGDKDDDVVVATAPTIADLVTAGSDTYLDFPGNPRDPKCAFETYFKQTVSELGLQPTIYAKYVYSPNERRLYLEFWYYIYFNDWNDTHESDWEMIALGFNAETPEEALSLQPSWVGYAQHGGGETATWNDEKLQKDGTHPYVYLSANSHASYYSANTMIGWGENGTAFGCDVTTGPSNEVRPQVVVIPDEIDGTSPFGWALYQGRWGERDVAMFTGPKGPNLGNKWNDPEAAFSTWRPTVLKVPDAKAAGVSTTDLFCGLSGAGSRAFVYFGSHPWAVGLLVAALLGIIALAVSRIWPFFMEALDIYGNELRTFLGIGTVAIPIGILVNVMRVLLEGHAPLRWFAQFTDGAEAGDLYATLFVAVFQQLLMLLVVAPAIIYALKEIRQGIKPGVWESYRGGVRNLPQILLSVLVVAAVLLALSWSIVLIPIAIYLLVRWQFFTQAIVFERKRGWRDPIATSWAVTRGRWLRTFTVTFAFQLLGALPGPVVGIVMMIIGGTDVKFANFVSSFVYAAFVPLSVIGLSMAYRRVKGDIVIEPHVMTRERDPEKAARDDAAIREAMEGAGVAL